ncbi:hypothetical protein ISS30_05635 [bacterium]|nr:hypothetical protein [FCB group bacterium]MBL7191157.1 hypothetical protein [bacterium]
MKKMILVLIAALSLTLVLMAQPGPPPPPDAPEVQERIRTMHMWKLTETLDMTAEQSDKFLPLYREFENDVAAVRSDNDALFERIQAYIVIGDGKAITGLIEKIEANEQKILERRSKFRKDASKILNEIQIGKLTAFQREFPSMLNRELWDMRRDRKRQRIHSPGVGPNCPQWRGPQSGQGPQGSAGPFCPWR